MLRARNGLLQSEKFAKLNKMVYENNILCNYTSTYICTYALRLQSICKLTAYMPSA